MASGKAGSLLIDIAANTAQIKKDMADAKESVSGFGKTVEGVASAVKGYFSVMVAREVIDFVKDLVTAVGDLEAQSKQLGLSTQDFQAFTIALQQAGAKGADVQTMLAAGSRFLGQAMEGNKANIDTLNKLKVTILDASGAARSSVDDFQRLAAAILAIKDPTTQAAVAQQIFGKAAKEMLPALQAVSGGIDSLRANAGRAIIPDDVIKRFDDFQTTVKTVARTLVADLAVSLDSLAGAGDGTAAKALQNLINLILDIGKNLRILADSDTGKVFAAAWAASLLPFNALLHAVDLLITGLTALPGLVDAIVTKFRQGSIAAQEFAKSLPSSDPGLSASGPGNPILTPAQQAAAKAAADAQAKSQADADAQIKKLQAEQDARAQERARRTLAVVAGTLPALPDPPALPGADKGSNPPPKPTGTVKPDYFANTLKGLQDQTKAVVDGTKQLADSSGLATKEAERLAQLQIDIAKNTAEAIKAAHATTPEQKAQLQQAVTDLDTAKFRLADYKTMLATADQVQSTFGDGTKALSDRMEYLGKALDAGKISQEEYTKASTAAHEAQALQAETAKGLEGGLDGIVAGWNHAALAASGAGAEMKIGEQAFTQTFSLMSNAISEFVTTGQVDFGKLAQSFATMLANMAIQWAAAAFLKDVLGTATTGGVPYGPPAPATASATLSGGMRAEGGPVLPGRAYTVGENGPERFIPSMPGVIAAANNNSNNVNVNVDMGGNSNNQNDPRQTVEFARRIRAAVVDTISNEKRPGGVLYTRQTA